jgi:GntR family transcriptional regulator
MSDRTALALPGRRALVPEAAAAIRRGIEAGRWPVGARLPGEPELADELGVSRATLREAVRLLISERLLERRPGVGTFVVRVPPTTIERGIDELFSLHEAIEHLGHRPSIGRCEVALLPAPAAVAAELGLAPASPVYRVQRVRLADGRPVILCDDYVDPRRLGGPPVGPDRVAAEVVALGSIYRWLERRIGVPIDSAYAHVEAVSASGAEADALALVPGTALIRLRQVHFTADGHPVLYSINLHNGDFMHFHVLRRRVPAQG